MSVKYTSNAAKILIDTSRRASLGLRFILDDIQQRSTPNTPLDKGPLRQSVQKQVLGLKSTIVWPQKYAQTQEAGTAKGRRFTNYTTAGTGPHFAETAVIESIKNATASFRKSGLI